MPEQPTVRPVRKEKASREIGALLEDIQDTMGIPWPPANWRSYAMYPGMMRLFWERLKPAVATEGLVHDALEIAGRAYHEAGAWYRPDYAFEVAGEDRQRMQWELDAFEFGNAQLLIQQVALSRALEGRVVGMEGCAEPRQRPSPYRRPEIHMIPEEQAPAEVKALYRDIEETLGLPIVNSDYQALAKWPAFLAPAWADVKVWRRRDEYQRLRQELALLAEAAADRLPQPLQLEAGEVEAVLGSPDEAGNVRGLVAMFTQLMPGLIANDALFRVGVATCVPVAGPTL
jgi:hypothetical protein